MTGWPHWLLAVLVVVPTLVAAAGLGWPVTAWVLRCARVAEPPPVELSGDARSPVVTRREAEQPVRYEVLGGGAWIGVLERLALTGAILAGRFELAAVVVAVKALGRYPEIRENPAVSEKFIIGTLTSLLVAGGCGAIGLTVLRALT